MHNDCLGNGVPDILAGSLGYCAVAATGVKQHESGVLCFGVAGVLPFSNQIVYDLNGIQTKMLKRREDAMSVDSTVQRGLAFRFL